MDALMLDRSGRPGDDTPPPMPNTNRILLVEDDRDTLELVFTLLIRQGYSVFTADNGQRSTSWNMASRHA